MDQTLIDSLENAVHISHEPRDEGKVLEVCHEGHGPVRHAIQGGVERFRSVRSASLGSG
ncbi:MAG: hypothetical protein HQ515_15435 [Phycisphaeraceae bacterium]|nr:hypothetical protein [Phycisphaeraceae bacterium]